MAGQGNKALTEVWPQSRGLQVCKVPEPLKPCILEVEPFGLHRPLGNLADTAHVCAMLCSGRTGPLHTKNQGPVSQAMCVLACDQAVSRPMIPCVFTLLPAISNFSHQH